MSIIAVIGMDLRTQKCLKLDQMNNVLQEIVDTIEDDTLLAVFGDHGMTSHGDHGGSTEAEIASSLFLYSGGHTSSNDSI